ncbi:MAG: AAA family ATPase [Polyangiaceae bacterium]|nr:AAA family ATPase [Polyangiaceae bacterium]
MTAPARKLATTKRAKAENDTSELLAADLLIEFFSTARRDVVLPILELVEPKYFPDFSDGRVFDVLRLLHTEGRSVDSANVKRATDAGGPASAAAYDSWLEALGRRRGGSGMPSPSTQAAKEAADTLKAAWTAKQVEAELERAAGLSRVGNSGELAELLRGLAARVEAEANPDGRVAIETFGVADMLAPLGPVPWLVSGLAIAPGAPTLIAGFGFSRKSLFAEGLALSVISGVPFLGEFPTRSGSVLELQAEQGRRLTIDRYQRLARGHGVDLRAIAPDSLRVATLPPCLDRDDAEALLLRAIAPPGRPPTTMVILDSLRALVPTLDENSSDVRRPLDMLTRLSEKTGATFVVIHHAGKPSADRANGARFAPRGSSAIFDAAQSVFVLASEDGKAPSRVTHTKDRILGATVDDFAFASEDVAINGNPRGGLLLKLVGVDEAEAGAASTLSEAKARILRCLAHDRDCRSASELARRVTGRKATVLAALQELQDRGLVVFAEGALRLRSEVS